MPLSQEERVHLYEQYIEIVKDCRKQNGMSQTDLAERCGVSHKYVTLLEGGQRTPSVECLLSLLAGSGARKSTAEELLDELLNSCEWVE